MTGECTVTTWVGLVDKVTRLNGVWTESGTTAQTSLAGSQVVVALADE